MIIFKPDSDCHQYKLGISSVYFTLSLPIYVSVKENWI